MELPPIVISSASTESAKRSSIKEGEVGEAKNTHSTAVELTQILEQLATHVPDLVVHRSHDEPLPQTVHSYGVVMFADISGFTALCEMYCSDGKSKQCGTDQLTTTLNSYLSQIVQAILEAGGDILKFAGDALLALWSCSRFAASGMLAYVLQESLMMQNDFDNFQTSDGVTLRMKIGLSVGKVEIHYIGNDEYKTFDVTGRAVDDVNKAQSLAKSGTVIISKAAWEMSNKQRCIAKLIGPGYAQVSKLAPESSEEDEAKPNTLPSLIANETRRPTIDNVLRNATTARRHSATSTRKTSLQSAARGNPWKEEKRMDDRKTDSSLPGQLQQLGKGLNFRTGLKDGLAMITPEALLELRTFVLQTVLHKIDHGHEVDWLSELREVSVLFINLDPGEQSSIDASGKQNLLQTSFNAIYPSLIKYGGSLNKVFMFDKGCTFLCIYGLPHAKHEDDAFRALRSSREIFNNLKSLELQQHSIGVTTGVAFCGVVGHPQRHEYTVIGQKVNMAARLMMKFSNAVTCDETTQIKSNIPANQFTLAPPVTLKGITNPENIYSFSLESYEALERHSSDMHESTDADDLIGREKEMAMFLEELQHVSEHTHRDPGVILISGAGGLGKTKLLRAMKAKAAMMDFRVVSGIGGLVEQNTPFFTVKVLITRLLELDSCKNMHEREQLILQHIVGEEMRSLLPLLNDILVFKFPHSSTTAHMCNTERTKSLHKLLFSIVHQEALSKPCVFGIDDAHWIDPDSWSFLLDLALDPNAILVLTTRPLKPNQKHPAMLEILNHPHTKMITLGGLNPDDMIKLACQVLKVDALPTTMQLIIRKRSHGIPLWCEELVETMLELEYLQVIEQDEIIMEEEEEETEEEEEDSEYSSVDTTPTDNSDEAHTSEGQSNKILRQPSTSGRKVVLKQKVRRRSTCQLSSGIGIGDIPIPDSLAGMVLTRVDHMSPSEQMTLKCAAIIGTSFNRSMLAAIIPNCNPATFHCSLNTLAEVGIIECSVAAEVKSMHSDMHTRSSHHLPIDDPNLHCPCLLQPKKDHGNHLSIHTSHKHGSTMHPPVDECEMLQFVHTYIQETVYDLWTESQRKSLHETAALFLESQAHKCKNCGGGGFIAGVRKPDARKKSAGPSGRAFIGTANVKNKLRRRSAAGTRRASVMSRTSLDSTFAGSWSTLPGIAPTRSSCTNLQASRPTTAADTEGRGLRYDSICATAVVGIDMQDCHCDEILAHVYPQLVRHWRAAGDMHKTLNYLIEAASAAISTFNNMEALSLLHETKHVMEEHGSDMITFSEHARIESLIAQALFQSGQVDECIPHFQAALRLLHSRLPVTLLGTILSLGFQTLRQWLHIKFPGKFTQRQRGQDSEAFLDQARCMAHVTHAYHLQHENLRTLMAALKQLNAVEEAQEDIHELIEAYATMIECCQLFDFKGLASYYLEKAMSLCNDVQFGVDDLTTYVHLLSVALNSKLCHGNIPEALEIGTAASRITSRLHDVAMEMASLPLLFYAQLASFKVEACQGTLKHLREIAGEADDLRAQALYDCCQFDALLEFGVNKEEGKKLAAAAEICCEEDVYHFDNTERFFLVSCLALWHSRAGNQVSAEKYLSISEGFQPSKYETFISVRALSRFTECQLLLWRLATFNHSLHRKRTIKALKKMKVLLPKFTTFKPRYLHLYAYKKHIQRKHWKVRKLLAAAVQEAKKCGSIFDAEWASCSVRAWFKDACMEEKEATALEMGFVLP